MTLPAPTPPGPTPTPPESPAHPLEFIETAVERAFGQPEEWSRGRRWGLGMLAFVAYLAAAQLEAGWAALVLAVGFFLMLQRWVVDGPSGPRMGETYAWAGISFVMAAAAFAIWWWRLGPEGLQAWSTHVWLPLGIVAIALLMEGYRRPATPVETIGQALARARTEIAGRQRRSNSCR